MASQPVASPPDGRQYETSRHLPTMPSVGSTLFFSLQPVKRAITQNRISFFIVFNVKVLILQEYFFYKKVGSGVKFVWFNYAKLCSMLFALLCVPRRPCPMPFALLCVARSFACEYKRATQTMPFAPCSLLCYACHALSLASISVPRRLCPSPHALCFDSVFYGVFAWGFAETLFKLLAEILSVFKTYFVRDFAHRHVGST